MITGKHTFNFIKQQQQKNMQKIKDKQLLIDTPR